MVTAKRVMIAYDQGRCDVKRAAAMRFETDENDKRKDGRDDVASHFSYIY